jgi:hypothetical protein
MIFSHGAYACALSCCFFVVGAVRYFTSASQSLYCETTVHDFGTVHVGQVLEHAFVLQNTSRRPLDSLSVAPSCGCTTVKGLPTTIAPQTALSIPVRFDTTGMRGKVRKLILVEAKGPHATQLQLAVEADIVHQVRVTPEKLVIDPGKSSTAQTFSISIKGEEKAPEFQIVDVWSSSHKVDVRVEPVDPGREYRVIAQLQKFPSDDSVQEYIKVTTDLPYEQKLIIPVHSVDLDSPAMATLTSLQ